MQIQIHSNAQIDGTQEFIHYWNMTNSTEHPLTLCHFSVPDSDRSLPPTKSSLQASGCSLEHSHLSIDLAQSCVLCDLTKSKHETGEKRAEH